eukprot:10440037-Lingulodinium_polyedra.AAC.1
MPALGGVGRHARGWATGPAACPDLLSCAVLRCADRPRPTRSQGCLRTGSINHACTHARKHACL